MASNLGIGESVESDVRLWLERVVIGLGLCPFAAQPTAAGRVRIRVSDADNDEAVLQALHEELVRLDAEPDSIETTLLAIPRHLGDFDDYNQFLDLADGLIEQFGWSGRYQIASFHPDYRFAGTDSEDAENLTNRAPCALLHLIREESLAQALESFSNPEEIPARNIERMQRLTDVEKRELFPYLFATGACKE